MICEINVFSSNLATVFQLLSARKFPCKSLSLCSTFVSESRKDHVFFCVNSGNGASARALAVPDSHGQSRDAITKSQEGLSH